MNQPKSDLPVDKVFAKPDSGARRTRLREFQAQLVERMQNARSGEVAAANQLGVMIGGKRYLLNLQTAGEIVVVGTISQVPLTQPWFLGLSNIRGNLISVIDFACFQGLPPTSIDKDSRIVAFSPVLAFNSGLLVSRVLGLHNVAEMEQQAAVESPSMSWLGKCYTDRESHTWTELDLALLIQNPQFLHVGL